MIRVVMPFAIPSGEALKALFMWAPRAEVVHVGGDDFAYWDLFLRLWREGQPFVVVEHDIVIREDTIQQLKRCDQPWCAFPYHQEIGEPVTGMGCTKFEPDGAPFLGAVFVDPFWANVDATVAGVLQSRGWTVHRHEPWLRHLNPKVEAMQESRNPE